MSMRSWIDGDESAKEMFARVLKERPLLLLPPLHRVPLRFGNVVELVGASPSAKTHVLIQAAITCILPKDWDGVHYGGLDHLVAFIDLDCRFDVSRLAEMLKHRILERTDLRKKEHNVADGRKAYLDKRLSISYNDQLFDMCMRRFLYIRCYDSYEFLATLKTLRHLLQKEQEAQGISFHFLMIDGIGALHWVDRAMSSFPLGVNINRKGLSLQNLWETVVIEIRKILMVHPMLVFATKTTIYGDSFSAAETKKNSEKFSSRDAMGTSQKLLYREYMPFFWQLNEIPHWVCEKLLEFFSPTFEVRFYLMWRAVFRYAQDLCTGYRFEDDHIALNGHEKNESIFLLEWLLPSLAFIDKFTVTDAGIFTVL